MTEFICGTNNIFNSYLYSVNNGDNVWKSGFRVGEMGKFWELGFWVGQTRKKCWELGLLVGEIGENIENWAIRWEKMVENVELRSVNPKEN